MQDYKGKQAKQKTSASGVWISMIMHSYFKKLTMPVFGIFISAQSQLLYMNWLFFPPIIHTVLFYGTQIQGKSNLENGRYV